MALCLVKKGLGIMAWGLIKHRGKSTITVMTWGNGGKFPHILNPGQEMQVSDQIHAPVDLLPVSTVQEAAGEEKNSCFCPKSKPGRPVRRNSLY
jgi:hypothetical protein